MGVDGKPPIGLTFIFLVLFRHRKSRVVHISFWKSIFEINFRVEFQSQWRLLAIIKSRVVYITGTDKRLDFVVFLEIHENPLQKSHNGLLLVARTS